MTAKTVFEEVHIPALHKPMPKLSKEATLTNVFEVDERKPAGSASEMVQRRLRALKKRLNKIEKYESEEKHKLNRDQLDAISKKPEVVYALKELEDLVKPMTGFEGEEAAKQEEKAKEWLAEADRRVAAAVAEVRAETKQTMQSMATLFFALNCLLPNRLAPTVTLTEEEFGALALFRAVVTGAGLELVETAEAFADHAQTCLDKYFAQSDELFFHSVSFKDLSLVVTKILNPPAVPKFVAEEEEEELEVVTEAVEEVTISTETPAISFINPSEVMVQPPVIQDWAAVPVDAEIKDVREEKPAFHVVVHKREPGQEAKTDDKQTKQRKPFNRRRREEGDKRQGKPRANEEGQKFRERRQRRERQEE